MEKQRTVHKCFEVTKNTLVLVVGIYQRFEKLLISAEYHGLRPSIQAWEMIIHNPAERGREREGDREKNHWLSCDHVMFSVMHYSYCKTRLICQVKIYQKCLLILWNTCRTSYLKSKVLLYTTKL